jgi:hypothetical protein
MFTFTTEITTLHLTSHLALVSLSRENITTITVIIVTPSINNNFINKLCFAPAFAFSSLFTLQNCQINNGSSRHKTTFGGRGTTRVFFPAGR